MSSSLKRRWACVPLHGRPCVCLCDPTCVYWFSSSKRKEGIKTQIQCVFHSFKSPSFTQMKKIWSWGPINGGIVHFESFYPLSLSAICGILTETTNLTYHITGGSHALCCCCGSHRGAYWAQYRVQSNYKLFSPDNFQNHLQHTNKDAYTWAQIRSSAHTHTTHHLIHHRTHMVQSLHVELSQSH